MTTDTAALEAEESRAREALLQAWRDHHDASVNKAAWLDDQDLSVINSRLRVLGIQWSKLDAALRGRRLAAKSSVETPTADASSLAPRPEQSPELRARLLGGVAR